VRGAPYIVPDSFRAQETSPPRRKENQFKWALSKDERSLQRPATSDHIDRSHKASYVVSPSLQNQSHSRFLNVIDCIIPVGTYMIEQDLSMHVCVDVHTDAPLATF
jgi:hypothetical protein